MLLSTLGFKIFTACSIQLNTAAHRGAFCQFPFRWIYYCHISKSTGKETDKTQFCAVYKDIFFLYKLFNGGVTSSFIFKIEEARLEMVFKSFIFL
jgi:hypothetical protein